MAEYKTGRAIRWEHFEHCPMPASGGADCWAEPHPASRHGLCVEHWREVVQDWATDSPEISRRCASCGIVNKHETVEMFAALCTLCGNPLRAPGLTKAEEEQMQAIERDEERAADQELGEMLSQSRVAHETRGVVYYMRFGDRVKIGFSERLEGRKKQIWHDEVLAAEPGNYEVEHDRQKQFEANRVEGQREWFHATPELLELARQIRDERGDPDELAREIWERNQVRVAA